jgi:integrase
MKQVDAVKSKEQITRIETFLNYPQKKLHAEGLYGDIWRIGLNLSLRIGDLLAIRYDKLDLENRMYTLKEAKTGKSKDVRLNNTVIRIIERRMKDHPKDEWLFQTNSNRSKGKPVSREHVSRIFKEVGDRLNIRLGTHSMRKTRGYIMFSDGKPIEMISKVLNHSCPSVTMAYLGITKDEVMATYDEYEL